MADIDCREHHYAFAHQAVRQICAQDPLQFFSIMASPDQADFVAWIRGLTEQTIGTPIRDIDPQATVVSLFRIADCPAVVIQMPPPIAVAEASFVAAVLSEFNLEKRSDGPQPFRYLTLELGLDLEVGERTVLCEWKDESHLNYGTGPAPELGPFCQAVEALLRQASR